jgi:hypothetical protein
LIVDSFNLRVLGILWGGWVVGWNDSPHGEGWFQKVNEIGNYIFGESKEVETR